MLCPGLWESVNLIKSSDVWRFCRDQGISLEFNKQIANRMIDRIDTDLEFTKRRPRASVLYLNLLKRLKVDQLVALLPIRMHPYVWMIIRKSSRTPVRPNYPAQGSHAPHARKSASGTRRAYHIVGYSVDHQS